MCEAGVRGPQSGATGGLKQEPVAPAPSIFYIAICALILGGLGWMYMTFICVVGEAFGG